MALIKESTTSKSQRFFKRDSHMGKTVTNKDLVDPKNIWQSLFKETKQTWCKTSLLHKKITG